MRDLFEQLITVDFAQYKLALAEIRKRLEGGEDYNLSKGDFLFLLRPYYWFVHNPGFQDIIDTCERAMEVIAECKDDLLEVTNPILGNEYLAVGTFLAGYLDEGDFDTTGWKSMFASAEVTTAVTAEKYAKKLNVAGKPSENVEALENLSKLMKDIEGTKHVTYWCLRVTAARHLEDLAFIMHTFPPDDQAYVLHALDAFPGNAAVVAFFQAFIEKTKYDTLKEEAGKYLESVQS